MRSAKAKTTEPGETANEKPVITTKKLRHDQIRMNCGTQSRMAINQDTVADYAADMEEGDVFPPVECVFDGKEYYLWDGFHRIEAEKKIGFSETEAKVREGSLRDAVLLSLGANSKNGMRRTNEDKRHAVKTLLMDDEWSKWSDSEIARRAGVAHSFVSKVRPQLSTMESSTRVCADGKTRDVSKIGKGKNGSGAKSFTPDPDPEPAEEYPPLEVIDETPPENAQQGDDDDFPVPDGPEDLETASKPTTKRCPRCGVQMRDWDENVLCGYCRGTKRLTPDPNLPRTDRDDSEPGGSVHREKKTNSINPDNAMLLAEQAIACLKRINPGALNRRPALDKVLDWISENR